MESIGMIRLRLTEGMSQQAIARELEVSRKTIRKVQRIGATTFEYARTKAVPRKAIGAYIAQLHGFLDINTTLTDSIRIFPTAPCPHTGFGSVEVLKIRVTHPFLKWNRVTRHTQQIYSGIYGELFLSARTLYIQNHARDKPKTAFI